MSGFRGLMMMDQGSQMNLDLEVGKVICLLINLCQQQINNKQLKSFRNNMSQKNINIRIDEQNNSRPDHGKIQQLLKQNQMKDLALKKANNLIELLNIELQVQRNSHQEDIKLAEQQFKFKYQRQNNQLQSKVEFLEREIKAKLHTTQNQKTIRKSVLTRANSSKSMENVKKRAVHQKYTESFQEIPLPKQPINIELQICKKQALQLEEWRQEIMKLLNNLIKQEYDELEDIVNSLENMGEDYQQISSFKPKNKKKQLQELTSIIQSQNGIINSLKAYCQHLEDICKNMIFKLNSIFTAAHQQPFSTFSIEQQIKKMSKCMTGKKQQWTAQRTTLEGENNQLKYILDSMIKLVRQQKKIK